MTKRRVVLLGTYPIAAPQHGGQRRVRAIADCYSQHGWQVKQIAAYPRGWYRRKSKGWRGWFRRGLDWSEHIEFPKTFVRYMQHHGLRADLHAYKYFEQNKDAREQLIHRIEGVKPHIIQFEQPWLFPVLRDYLRQAGQEYFVVYSSHNVEAHLIQSILMQEHHPRAKEFAQEAMEWEQALVRFANLTICVTKEDASVVRSWRAREVLVAPNGASRRLCPKNSFWEQKTRGHPYAFVIGSAHPPNSNGFLEMLGTEFEYVPPEAKVVVAGGMAHLLQASPAFQQSNATTQQVILLADPTEEDLGYLLNHAQVILLPVTHGGGSNIKTAEALLSDRPIIGTSTALRGFHAFRNASGVIVEDDPGQFRLLVQRALIASSSPPVHRPNTDQLLWENSVREIPAVAEMMLATN